MSRWSVSKVTLGAFRPRTVHCGTVIKQENTVIRGATKGWLRGREEKRLTLKKEIGPTPTPTDPP